MLEIQILSNFCSFAFWGSSVWCRIIRVRIRKNSLKWRLWPNMTLHTRRTMNCRSGKVRSWRCSIRRMIWIGIEQNLMDKKVRKKIRNFSQKNCKNGNLIEMFKIVKKKKTEDEFQCWPRVWNGRNYKIVKYEKND